MRWQSTRVFFWLARLLLGTSNQLIQPFEYPAVGNKFYRPYNTMQQSPAYLDLVTNSIYALKPVGYACSSGPSFTWKHMAYHLNGKSYFLATETNYGLEMFGTDYTPAGTSRLKDIYPGSSSSFDNSNSQNLCSSNYFYIKPAPANLFFGADDGANGFEMWVLHNVATNPVAVHERKKEAGMRLYPNPASDLVRITGEAINGVKLYNALGVMVREKSVSSKSEIVLETAGLPQGVYIVNVSSAGGEFVIKFIKGG